MPISCCRLQNEDFLFNQPNPCTMIFIVARSKPLSKLSGKNIYSVGSPLYPSAYLNRCRYPNPTVVALSKYQWGHEWWWAASQASHQIWLNHPALLLKHRADAWHSCHRNNHRDNIYFLVAHCWSGNQTHAVLRLWEARTYSCTVLFSLT